MKRHKPARYRDLSSIKPKITKWLWKPFIARRQMTILEGDPGVGKSFWQ
ncbi:AAA family ATPase [Parvularcula marina]|uniref:AAA family ATPase n=1 Tax=Parvularcula marina TaxID=2292771 RepID=A0A371R7I3_9PROT|nr:hypothetical protein DX908_14070 [Parvularcula marina]